MIATLIEPYATVRGSISKRDKLYTRMLNGRCLIQHKPRRASPAQRAHRDWFGKTYGSDRKNVLCSERSRGGSALVNIPLTEHPHSTLA